MSELIPDEEIIIQHAYGLIDGVNYFYQKYKQYNYGVFKNKLKESQMLIHMVDFDSMLFKSITQAINFYEFGSTPFKNYLARVFSRSLISYLRDRKKELLETALSLDEEIYNTDNLVLSDVIQSDSIVDDVKKITISKDYVEKFSEIFVSKDKRRDLQILMLRMEGRTYKEISQIMNLGEKWVRQIVNKMKEMFESSNFPNNKIS